MNVMDLFSLKGKVAIVTGGSVGLGAQMAEALAEAGADIVIAARKVERCADMCKKLEALGVKALAVACDIGREEDCQNLVDAAVREFGRLDILVNNAGIAFGAESMSYPMDKWQTVINTNITGTFQLSVKAAKIMKEHGGGKIINIASMGALRGDAPEIVDSVSYSSSKGAVLTMTKDLAVKWARYGIYVNAICPGWFPTDMSSKHLTSKADVIIPKIPLRRYGGENDLKGVVVYLASAASDYMTAQYMVIDGGITEAL
ncbi:MAG: glucose 1-dehydrogenase [Clostridiales bacterium]|nr:glucose 1-dehydrogenase [Clostridiales bacterium]